MEFKQWLESATRPGNKQGLYPIGYGGIGLYPPADMMNWGADAITYMSEKDRKFSIGDTWKPWPSPKFSMTWGVWKNPFSGSNLS